MKEKMEQIQKSTKDKKKIFNIFFFVCPFSILIHHIIGVEVEVELKLYIIFKLKPYKQLETSLLLLIIGFG